LTNITNPKALLFCSVLLPQFVHADAGNVGGQFLLLGVVLVAIGLLFDVLYAMAGVALGYWIEGHPVVQTVQRWTFAAMLIGFGARLAVVGRPE
jgi:threonine/homoserine/homoserine lactone efflux protein